MFTQDEVDAAIESGKLRVSMAAKMLNIYVCESNWEDHIERYSNLIKRKRPHDHAESVRNQVSFVILFPAYDRTIRIDTENPSNNLFTWPRFHQATERDWFSELQRVVRQDAKNDGNRKHVLELGVIEPIEYQPFARQGFKWLCEKAAEEGSLTPGVESKFKKLVSVYGGKVVSNIFEKHDDVVRKMVNWRGGYFFERGIYDTYSLDQIKKIKQSELQRTNSKWIRKVGG